VRVEAYKWTIAWAFPLRGTQIMKLLRRLKEQKGATLIETALVLPLVVLVLVSTMEWGLLFHRYLNVQTACREGARVAALGVAEGEITQHVRDYATYLGDEIAIQVTNAEGSRGQPVTVRVTYDFVPITPLMEGVLGQNPYPMIAEVTMRLE
jgi:Flp pilus assembly protein TadG